MCVMQLIVSILLLLLAQTVLTTEIQAQTQTAACPSISIRDEDGYEVDGLVCFGKISFTVTLAGTVPTDKPAFNWAISRGQIVGGQGTSSITVLPDDVLGIEVVAAVDISGVASLSTDISSVNEEGRLTNYAFQLKEEPGSVGYLFVYGSRRVSERLTRIRKFLIRERGIVAERLVLLNGGYNKKTKVELWIAPLGSAAPKPDPNFRD